MIDLLEVAGQDNFRALASSCDDCLHLVRRQILSLVHNEIRPLQAAAANVRQWGNFDPLVLDHVGDLQRQRRVFVTQHRQVVVQRLHVRIEFRIDVPRQKSEIAVTHRPDRTSQQNLSLPVARLQRRSQSQ